MCTLGLHRQLEKRGFQLFFLSTCQYLQKAAHHLLMIFQATSSKLSYNGYMDRLDNNLSVFFFFIVLVL